MMSLSSLFFFYNFFSNQFIFAVWQFIAILCADRAEKCVFSIKKRKKKDAKSIHFSLSRNENQKESYSSRG